MTGGQMIGEILGPILGMLENNIAGQMIVNEIAGQMIGAGIEKTDAAIDRLEQVRKEAKDEREAEAASNIEKKQNRLDNRKSLPRFDMPSIYTCSINVREEIASFLDWHEVSGGLKSDLAIRDENGTRWPHTRMTENGWFHAQATSEEEWFGIQASVESREATLVIARRIEADDWLVAKAVLEQSVKGEDYPCSIFIIGEVYRSKKGFTETLFGLSDDDIEQLFLDYFSNCKEIIFDLLQAIDTPGTDVASELNNLCEMKSQGLLTADEFLIAKQALFSK